MCSGPGSKRKQQGLSVIVRHIVDHVPGSLLCAVASKKHIVGGSLIKPSGQAVHLVVIQLCTPKIHLRELSMKAAVLLHVGINAARHLGHEVDVIREHVPVENLQVNVGPLALRDGVPRDGRPDSVNVQVLPRETDRPAGKISFVGPVPTID